LNEQTLAQDGNGQGSGFFITDQDHVITASWSLTCIGFGDKDQLQVLDVHVESVNDVATDQMDFSIQFDQTEPTWIGSVDGAAAIVESSDWNFSDHLHDGDSPRSLDEEVAELKEMNVQLIRLQREIALKKQHLALVFASRHPSVNMGNCDSWKCVLSSVFDRVKGMAEKLYYDMVAAHRSHHSSSLHQAHINSTSNRPAFVDTNTQTEQPFVLGGNRPHQSGAGSSYRPYTVAAVSPAISSHPLGCAFADLVIPDFPT
jgi:hypothetical protein